MRKLTELSTRPPGARHFIRQPITSWQNWPVIKKRFGEALQHLERSLSTNTHHTKAQNLQAAIHRNQGEFDDAIALADRVRSEDPLDYMSLCETYLALSGSGRKNVAEEALAVMKERMHGNVQSYLELSMDYAGAGFWEDAISVLHEIYLEGEDQRETFPMVHYFLGYFWQQKGDPERAKHHYELASEQSPDYCFPFRLESIGILEAAAEINPSDARAELYLGNLLFDMQPERAMKAWEHSAALDDSFWLTHRNLGMAYYKVDNNIPLAVEHYLKAISLKPDDQRLLYEADLIRAAGREDPEIRLELLKQHHDIIAHNNVSDALSREIMLLVQLGRNPEALEVIEANHFKQWEGISKAYNSYVDAHLFLGLEYLEKEQYAAALEHMQKAGEFPAGMMVARPYRDGRAGQVYYHTGLVYESMGKDKLAMENYRFCVEERLSPTLDDAHFYKALALEKLGRKEEAKAIFDGLVSLGQKRLDFTQPDFFAKFGERETPDDRLSEAYFLMGMGYMGKKSGTQAKEMFAEAVRLNINHVWAAHYLTEIQQ